MLHHYWGAWDELFCASHPYLHVRNKLAYVGSIFNLPYLVLFQCGLGFDMICILIRESLYATLEAMRTSTSS